MKQSLKKISSVVLAILAVAMLFNVAGVSAQEPSPQIIRVTGYGTAYASPDVAYLSIGVEVANEDVQVAVNDANSRVEALQAALVGLGVVESDIRTENFYIYREVIYDNGTPTDRGLFRVSNYLRITVRDTTKVPEFLSASLEAGATTVNNVSFGIDDPSAMESEARKLAIADAQANAAELAALVGGQVGEVITVTEVSYGDPAFQYAQGGGFGGGGGGMMGGVTPPPVNAGSLAVNVSVEVTFALVR